VGTTPTSSSCDAAQTRAQKIADAFGCTLPTRKDRRRLDAAAHGAARPQAVDENREAVSAFVLANQKTERERAGQPLGGSSAGRKKGHRPIDEDLRETQPPGHLRLRQLDGQPISRLPMSTGINTSDYSHGVRLVRVAMPSSTASEFALMSCSPTRRGAAWWSDEGPNHPATISGD